MLRFTLLLAVGALVALPTAAFAQPGVPGSFQVVDAKVEKDKLTWITVKGVPVAKEVTVEVVKNGVKFAEKRTVTVMEFVPIKEEATLKELKATDGSGKAITADKLAELLKEATPVVMVSGGLSEKHRKLFKDTTVFLELPAGPGPGLAPPPPVPPLPPVTGLPPVKP